MRSRVSPRDWSVPVAGIATLTGWLAGAALQLLCRGAKASRRRR